MPSRSRATAFDADTYTTYTLGMAQVTIYLPDKLEKAIKAEARRSHQSLSAFIASLAAGKLKPDRWPSEFAELYGAWEGPFRQMADELPDEPGEF